MKPAEPCASVATLAACPGGCAVGCLHSRQRIELALHQLEHLLPAQAPLRDFVHHNTLHGLQHLPFAEALAEAARLSGARPWLGEERCRELYRQGRVNAVDLAAALRQMPSTRAEEVLFAFPARQLRRGEVLQAALLHPPDDISAVRLRWLSEERSAFERLPAALEPAARQRLLAAAAADRQDEKAAVADLWAAARALRPAAGSDGYNRRGIAALEFPAPTPQAAASLWQKMRSGLGRQWTLTTLLAHLTGEDLRLALQPGLIRHLAAHLDLGLAAWRNPALQRGFYAAWRESVGGDWAWEFDEFAGARHEIAKLPEDALAAIAGELHRLGVDEAQGGAYLQRLALELPGWAGMFEWRSAHPDPAPAAGKSPPVRLADFLAVRLVLERLYAEQLLRRCWGLQLAEFSELAEHFVRNPAELWVRHAFGSRQLPEEVQNAIWQRLGRPAGDFGDATASDAGADSAASWQQLAASVLAARSAVTADCAALAAWPLFMLAQGLGLCGRELRAMTESEAEALLRCARSLSVNERGLAWLLAYEHHHRQQILGALAANHGRMRAPAGKARAQFVMCMDDREEGTRRHLEEVDPTFETFGAAGFFGVPMLWQGLDDDLPSALCPVVVRPTNAVRELVPATSKAAQARHRWRRRLLLASQEKLHQGGRRGCLSAALVSVVAGAPALLALLARTLAPSRFAKLAARLRESFDRPPAAALQLTADAGEAGRLATADAPRQGFSEQEQLARVGGFLRSIGLTAGFAPLVVIIGHGSDSRNNPHLAAYDCGACSGRHGGPNARVLAAMANRSAVRAALAEQGIAIPTTTHFVGAEHNTCDETLLWYDTIPDSHRAAFAALRRDCAEALRRHAVERCRRFASAPSKPSPQRAMRHLADRRQDLAQARPELGHATVAAAFVGRRSLSRGAFFDRRVFLISYDPLPDRDGRVLEATLLAAGPVGAGISLEYYFSSVDNERFGCGSKIMHNLAGLFGIMLGASSDLRTGLPQQMVEVHEPMRLLVVVEQSVDIVNAIYSRQPPLQELIGKGWIVLAVKDPQTPAIHLFDPALGWQPWNAGSGSSPAAPPEVERSLDWFAGHREPLPPALLRRPVAAA